MDARAGLGLEDALERCREFMRIRADVTFLDAPESVEGMRWYCKEVDGLKLAIIIEVMFNRKRWPEVSGGHNFCLHCHSIISVQTVHRRTTEHRTSKHPGSKPTKPIHFRSCKAETVVVAAPITFRESWAKTAGCPLSGPVGMSSFDVTNDMC